MRQNVAATAITAALLLALTGCTSMTIEVTTTPAAETSETAETSTETAAPLVAETPGAVEYEDVEAAFVEKFHELRATRPGESQIPNATDEQLITAGWEACERMDAGESSELLSLIEGETKNGAGYYSDSGSIVTAARLTLCPAD